MTQDNVLVLLGMLKDNSELDSVTICGRNVKYDNGREEWMVYNTNGTYKASEDAYEASELVLALK